MSSHLQKSIQRDSSTHVTHVWMQTKTDCITRFNVFHNTLQNPQHRTKPLTGTCKKPHTSQINKSLRKQHKMCHQPPTHYTIAPSLPPCTLKSISLDRKKGSLSTSVTVFGNSWQQFQGCLSSNQGWKGFHYFKEYFTLRNHHYCDTLKPERGLLLQAP